MNDCYSREFTLKRRTNYQIIYECKLNRHYLTKRLLITISK